MGMVEKSATIEIKVNGEPALTVNMIGRRIGLPPASTRKALARLREAGTLEPVAHLDERTPLYGEVAFDEAWAARRGRGVGGGRPRKVESDA